MVKADDATKQRWLRIPGKHATMAEALRALEDVLARRH
jgi:hypothetical protein